MAKSRDEDRARRTLYVTGFNPKRVTKDLLLELFTQGGPVADITLFETHAYVLFQHEESIPYCLALLNDIELHNVKLRLSPRFKTEHTYGYVDYLAKVRESIRDNNMQQVPPLLPPKIYNHKSNDNNRISKSRLQQRNQSASKTKAKKRGGKKQKGRRNG